MAKRTLLYENSFASEAKFGEFRLEGQAVISCAEGFLKMQNGLSASLGQKANYVYWLDKDFPSDIEVEWEFKPFTADGLCILFFAAKGREGEDLFAPSLALRDGAYPQYHHGDINAFHVSYYRRKEADEKAFHTCNLRKSYGFHLVAQGADPIPDAYEDMDWYRLKLRKEKGELSFFVNELSVFHFSDDQPEYGPPLAGGKIGFRQLAPLVAGYRNLKVFGLD